MSQRSINVESLSGNSFLAVGLEVFQGAHVVEPVSQLNKNNSHVSDHSQEHLANIFRLAIFAVGELDFVDFGNALNNVGNLIAEFGFNLFVGGWGVFDGIVEKSRCV